jgi:hypothetical protein
MANESGMFVFTREELGWDEPQKPETSEGITKENWVPFTREELGWDDPQSEKSNSAEPELNFENATVTINGKAVDPKDVKYLFEPRPTLSESIAQVFTGTSQQATSSYSSTQKTPSKSSQNEEQAMEAMQSHVGGWFLGLVLGIIAFRIVRPKTKCSTPFEMARRWMSWGLMGGMTTGTTHFFRYGGAEGIAGGLLGVCFFSGAAWVLGLVWGGLRFRLFPKIVSASGSLDGEADKEIKQENLPGIREAAARGQAREQYLLGLCYYEGKGVVKNQVEAYKWMLLAQANGFEKARKLSAKMEKALSRSEVAEGQKLATQMQQG